LEQISKAPSFTAASGQTRLATAAGIVVAVIVIAGLLALGFDPIFCQGIAYAAGLSVFLTIDRRWAYPSSGDNGRRTSFFMLAAAVAYAISLALLSVFVRKPVLNVYVAQLVAGAAFLFLVVVFYRVAFASFVDRPLQLKQSFSWLFSPATGRGIFAAAIVVFLIIDAGALWNVSRSIEQRAADPTYDRVPQWIKSAECFKKTGIILVVCLDGRTLSPIEDASTADDRGHGLLLSGLHKWLDVPTSRAALVWINVAINLVGFALLALQIYRFGYRIAGIGSFLGALPWVSNALVNSDVIGASYGLFALSLLLPLQMLRQFSIDRQSTSEWIWFAVSALALVAVMLMREPFGSIAILISVVLVLACTIWRFRTFRVGHAALIVLSFASFWLAAHGTELLVKYRETAQGVPTGRGILTHGLSHNLYIGLGAEPNALGIEWSDTYAANLVKSIDPTVLYGSPKYFEVLGRAYVDLVMRHPVEVAKIYASKAAKVLTPKIVVWLTFAIAFMMSMLALYRLEQGKFVRQPPLSAICMVAVAATLLHAAQAIMTVPSPGYFTQANIGLVLIAALAVDLWFEAIWGRERCRPDQEGP